MLSISIFPGQEVNIYTQLEQLKVAKQLGYSYVFTSLHIPETNSDSYREFRMISAKVKELDMKLIVDISKECFKEEFIKENDVYYLRIDFGFNNQEIVEIKKFLDTLNVDMQINSSTISENSFLDLIKKGLTTKRLSACHNYYPLVGSGLSKDFVSGNKVKRGPEFVGLPTIENHRNADIYISSQELLNLETDSIIFGDTMANDYELETLPSLKKDKLSIKIDGEYEIYEKEFILRYDNSEEFLRFENSRKLMSGNNIDPVGTKEIIKYDIIIFNNLHKRYMNEIAVVFNIDMIPDVEKVNIIGSLKEYWWLLNNIPEQQKIEFIKEKRR